MFEVKTFVTDKWKYYIESIAKYVAKKLGSLYCTRK